MQNMPNNIDVLTPQNLLVALAVILVLLGAAVLFMEFVLKLRAIRKPQEKEASDLTTHQAECEKRFRNDRDRLDELERRVNDLERGTRVLCKGQYEVIGHLLHNGNKDEMEQASKALFDFLNS